MEEIELLVLPLGERIRIRSGAIGTPIRNCAQFAVLGGPFASEEQAKDAAGKELLSNVVEIPPSIFSR